MIVLLLRTKVSLHYKVQTLFKIIGSYKDHAFLEQIIPATASTEFLSVLYKFYKYYTDTE